MIAFGLIRDLGQEQAVEPGERHVHLVEVAQRNGREACEHIGAGWKFQARHRHGKQRREDKKAAAGAQKECPRLRPVGTYLDLTYIAAQPRGRGEQEACRLSLSTA